jgi:hypothetical protein
MTVVSVDEKTRDFSVAHDPIAFTIDGDTFDCYPALPAGVLIQFAIGAAKINQSDVEQQAKMLDGLFRLVLRPESADLFAARMTDPERPIELKQINLIIPWVMEAHGLRPTPLPAD